MYLHCENLRQGRYILFPTTFAPREFAKFLLRIYSERNIDPRELKQDAPGRGLCSCKKVNSVTRITVVGAEVNNKNEGLLLILILQDKSKSTSFQIRKNFNLSSPFLSLRYFLNYLDPVLI